MLFLGIASPFAPARLGHLVPLDLRPEAAEALGVFFLVFAGGAAILVGAGSLAVSLEFGLVVAVLIYALGHVCGAHYNPAITLAFALTGHFPWRRVARYVAAQIVGAIVAASALRWIFDSVAPVTTRVTPGLPVGMAFVVELLGAFLLALVIIAVATDRRAVQGLAGLAIGLTVAVNSLWAGPLTGASTNPARTLGPALLDAHWDLLWLYLLAPVAGASLGMLAYEWLRGGHKPVPGEALGALGPIQPRTQEA